MKSRLVACGVALGVFLATVADAETVNARVRRNPKLKAGTDSGGRVLLFTPKPIQPGSTHSHFDTSASPNLLMEPSINSDLKIFKIDLTKQAMQDLGWALGDFSANVSYTDSAGQGFNDPTLGAARKAALERAVSAWQTILGSSVTVDIEARFAEQRCEDGTGVLASAGPRFAFDGFAGSEAGIVYPGPLAESLASVDLSAASNPAAVDLRITVNSAIDNECLGAGSRFYYGLDKNVPPGEVSFVTVAMHELGHGLGFVGLVDESTGELFQGMPDIFTVRTYDDKKNKHWSEMTDAGRRKSAKRPRKVSFDGPKTTARAGRFLKGRVVIEISVPANLAGSYEVGEASFGSKIRKKGFSGDLALVNDGTATPTFACSPVLNGNEVSGKIAVIDRGDCLFTIKVKNAQDAGAIGVIIVHNEAGPPPGLGGSDASIRVPSVRIGKKDGKKIKRVLRR